MSKPYLFGLAATIPLALITVVLAVTSGPSVFSAVAWPLITCMWCWMAYSNAETAERYKRALDHFNIR